MHKIKMNLARWINESGDTQTAFARRVGVSHATVSRWLAGKTIPSRSAMEAVFNATGGKVTPNDLIACGSVPAVEDQAA